MPEACIGCAICGSTWGFLTNYKLWAIFVISALICLESTFCSFHRIEQNICLAGTSINKGCAVYYYSVVMHGLRIIRYLWTKCREKSVLRRLHRREQHTEFCIDSSKRSFRVDLHVVIAMWYTALYEITASFRQSKKRKFGVMWAGRKLLRQWDDLRVK